MKLAMIGSAIALTAASCAKSLPTSQRQNEVSSFLAATLAEGEYRVDRLSRDAIEHKIRDIQYDLYLAMQSRDDDLGETDTLTHLPVKYPAFMAIPENEYYKAVSDYRSGVLASDTSFRATVYRKRQFIQVSSGMDQILLNYLRVLPEQGILKLDGLPYANAQKVVKSAVESKLGVGYSGYQFEFRNPPGATLEDMGKGKPGHVEVNIITIGKLDDSSGSFIKVLLIDYNRGAAVHASSYILRKTNSL